jgi:hypothetical protein
MANLHATMTNSRGTKVSTINRDRQEVMAETWEVRIETTLMADGSYRVTVSDRTTGTVLQELSGQYPAPEKGENHA